MSDILQFVFSILKEREDENVDDQQEKNEESELLSSANFNPGKF